MRTLFSAAVLLAAFVAAGLWWQTPGAAQQAEVKIPPLAGQAVAGANLFTRYCAQCHGAAGDGTDKGPPLVHKIYAPGHHADGAFYLAALNGSRAHHWKFGNMPPVEGITEQQVAKIVAFVRAVQKENGIE